MNERIQSADFFDSLRPCIESQLLADFVRLDAGERLLDVGCGSGYLTLYLACKYPDCGGAVGVDVSETAVESAIENVERLHRLKTKMGRKALPILRMPDIRFINADVNTLDRIDGGFDVVVSNPPFFASDASRPARSNERRTARQDWHLTVEDLYRCAARQLREGGRMYAVLPAQRIGEVRRCAERCHFELLNVVTKREIRTRSGGIVFIESVYQATLP